MGDVLEKRIEYSGHLTDELTSGKEHGSRARGSGNQKETGFYLYEARLRKGLSLEEAAKGICSISYLSKIEKLEVAFDEGNKKHRLLKERLEVGESENDGNWLSKYHQQIWFKDGDKLKASIGKMQDGYRQRLLLLSLYVVLDLLGKASGLINYFYKIESYLSVSELQLLYFCLSCYFVGYGQSQYLLYSLRMARYFRLQDPLLHLQMAKYAFKTGADLHSFHFLERADRLFKGLEANISHIDCQLLKCQELLNRHFLQPAGHILNIISHIIDQFPPNQKAAYFLTQGLYHQVQGKSKEAESAFNHSLSLAKNTNRPIFEMSLIHLAAMYSRLKKEKLLEKLLHHESLDYSQLKKSTVHRLQFYKELLKPPAKNPNLKMLLHYQAIPQALDEHDKKSLTDYANTMIDYYESQGQYKKATQLWHQVQEFESHVKTFQISLSAYFQI